MLGGAIRFFQMLRAVSTDFEQPVGEPGSMSVLYPFKAFADSFGNGFS